MINLPLIFCQLSIKREGMVVLGQGMVEKSQGKEEDLKRINTMISLLL